MSPLCLPRRVVYIYPRKGGHSVLAIKLLQVIFKHVPESSCDLMLIFVRNSPPLSNAKAASAVFGFRKRETPPSRADGLTQRAMLTSMFIGIPDIFTHRENAKAPMITKDKNVPTG